VDFGPCPLIRQVGQQLELHHGARIGSVGSPPPDPFAVGLELDTARRAFDLVAEGFGPGFNGPLVLAVELSGDGHHDGVLLADLSQALTATDGVAHVSAPIGGDDAEVAAIAVFPTTPPQAAETAELVHTLRDDVVAGVAPDTWCWSVAGPPRSWTSPTSRPTHADLHRPGAVVSFLVLTAVFRSVVVAAKAVVLNLLSIGAAYGVLVAVFQWGWGAGVLGLGEPGPIEAWAPMMLFAILFGLSMDYEVFLLSRIKEEHDRSGTPPPPSPTGWPAPPGSSPRPRPS
jgi:putative drug exporter of the RND superfamily